MFQYIKAYDYYKHILVIIDSCDFTSIINFLQGVKAARGDFIGTHIFDHMFDMKAWLKLHLEALNNHSHPHIFRFRKGPDRHCYMQYKKWRHNEWEPPRCHGVCILKVCQR